MGKCDLLPLSVVAGGPESIHALSIGKWAELTVSLLLGRFPTEGRGLDRSRFVLVRSRPKLGPLIGTGDWKYFQ